MPSFAARCGVRLRLQATTGRPEAARRADHLQADLSDSYQAQRAAEKPAALENCSLFKRRRAG